MEAGNFTEFQNYQFAVMLTTNATSYLECYERCVVFDGRLFDTISNCKIQQNTWLQALTNCYMPQLLNCLGALWTEFRIVAP